MLCFVAKDNKDAEAFFKETLVQGSRIYLMGQVGNRVFTDEGVMATFRADRLVIGDQPPARDQDAGPKEPKAIFFTVEYDMATPDGTVRREHRKYKIPKPGVRYTIANPYDPTKPLYMTFQF